MIKGDIILIPFPFTDLSGVKSRPALVLFSDEVDITIAFITSQLKWQDEFDVAVQPAELNGLKVSSVIRLSKIATVDKNLCLGKLGSLSDLDLKNINDGLLRIFKLI